VHTVSGQPPLSLGSCSDSPRRVGTGSAEAGMKPSSRLLRNPEAVKGRLSRAPRFVWPPTGNTGETKDHETGKRRTGMQPGPKCPHDAALLLRITVNGDDRCTIIMPLS